LDLNAQKCTVTNFTRNTVNFINYNYKIGGTQLENKTVAKDLGILFDNKLSFAEHINAVYNKCIKLLGFIFRSCSEFKNPKTSITLFNSLIRSRLEYCSTIWSSHYDKYIELIEKLQKKLVKFMFHKNLIYPTPEEFDYLRCCGILGIDTLGKSRIMQDLKFLVRSVKNEVDTQSFMNNLNFSVPHRATRQMEHFKPHGFRTEAGKFSVFNRLMSLFNTFGADCDLFFDKRNNLIKKLRTNLNNL
jgi:hypothetical protein